MWRGGWLATITGTCNIFAARGNRTPDFYRYDAVGRRSYTLSPLPTGPSGKPPYTGSRAVGDGDRYIYHIRGNSTLEFMRYDVETDSWQFLPDVPAGTWPKVRGGSCIEYARRGDTGYVYVLKGKRWDFLRYNTASREWSMVAPPPFEPKGKEGTWLCYDLERFMYALPAKSEMLYRYDVIGDSWCPNLPGMPFVSGFTRKTKKPGDGGGGCWHDGNIYALKGGNTQDFFVYNAATRTWTERDTFPSCSWTTPKKRRVKSGGCIISYEYGNVIPVLFALKGNKTTDIWMYEPYRTQSASVRPPSGPQSPDRPPYSRSGSMLAALVTAPPVTACYDALGRRVNSTGSLRPGVYYFGPSHRRVVVVR